MREGCEGPGAKHGSEAHPAAARPLRKALEGGRGHAQRIIQDKIQLQMKNISLFLLLLFPGAVIAQSGIDNVLGSIAKNNKSILANQQYWEARKLQYKTGIYLANPFVEYDYMIGTPAEAGNQRDFTVTQSFDFPTAYIKRQQLANQQIAQADHQQRIQRQDILLEAKLHLLELVYLNKRKAELTKRVQNAVKLQQDFQTKLDKGDGNILDVNKAKLQRISIENELRQTDTQINVLLQKLTALNGGNAITFNDTIYPASPDVPAFEVIEKTIEESDPNMKYFQQEKEIASKQVELSRSLQLPRFEAGYHSQAILGQNFRGAHVGISIPLWENKNTVKYQKANVMFADLQIEQHRNEHYYEIKQQYEQYTNLKKTFEEYKATLAGINSDELLWKALQLGQISTIEYYMEISYFYSAYDNYLNTEKEYNQAIATLYKYTL